jgi:hypothetical protein
MRPSLARPYYRVRSTGQWRPSWPLALRPALTPEVISQLAADYRREVEKSRAAMIEEKRDEQ